MVKRIILIVAIAMIAFSGVAMADDTTTVSVSASVNGTCKFRTGGTIIFGALDPNSGVDVDGTITQPTFWCSKGLGYTISDDNGLHESGSTHNMLGPSADLIPYTFTYSDTGTGSGAGSTNTKTMNIASTVLGADYINATHGSYSDTVTLTIPP